MAKNHPKNCLNCRTPFIARNLRGEYCSPKCRVSHYRKKKRNVTQNGAIAPSEADLQLQKMKAEIEKEEMELASLQNKIAGIETKDKEKYLIGKALEVEEKKQLEKRNNYTRLHGKRKSGGDIAQAGFDLPASGGMKILMGILGGYVDNQFNNGAVNYDYTREIKEIDLQLVEIRKKKPLPFLGLGDPQLSYCRLKAEAKIIRIEKLKTEYKKTEEDMSKKSIIKELDQLKDADGFVSAKDVKNINFADRITLDGDIGQFMGALEKFKCAITLTGKQGSGKTFFSFDLISKFIRKHLTVAYFSCEEGISQLTREKLIQYLLDNEENLKIRENANLQDIQRAADKFDVIVIDSWGKLNTDISEFDKLRLAYPKTIFVVIFQQTSSGQMRGGTMAAYDAGVNIETSFENDKRIAVCKKNRYGKTGVRYFIDGMEIEK